MWVLRAQDAIRTVFHPIGGMTSATDESTMIGDTLRVEPVGRTISYEAPWSLCSPSDRRRVLAKDLLAQILQLVDSILLRDKPGFPMQLVLQSHLIPCDTDLGLWSDDYERCLVQRQAHLAAVIQQACGGRAQTEQLV